MNLLVVGDFHGTFPSRLEGLIDKEKIDLVVSNGDYLPFHYRDLWFKHCYKKDKGLWEVIGKGEYKKLVLKDLDDGEMALRKLNRLGAPVITVLGNMDYPNPDDIVDLDKPKWSWEVKRRNMFSERLKKYKNIRRFDYSSVRFGDFVFIGARGHSAPGKVRSEAYRSHKRILEGLFEKFKEENREGKVIFVGHNVPYDTKLDKIGMRAHKLVRGKHGGSKMFRRLIDKYQPVLAVGGHIHERVGKQKLGRTMVVNPGAVHEGKAAVVGLNGKVKVKFVM